MRVVRDKASPTKPKTKTTERKKTMNTKTASNEIIAKFAMDKAWWVHYEQCQLYKPGIDGAVGLLGGNCCDEVWKDNTAYERELKEGSDLYLVFGDSTSTEHLYIRMRDGEAFYNKEGETFYGKYNILRLGVLDAEDIKVLVPLYNQLYLDRWAKNYMDEEVPETQVGVHDEFTLLAQSIVNPVFTINVPEWRKVGAVKFRKIDEYDLDKRLVIAKTASDDRDIIAWA